VEQNNKGRLGAECIGQLPPDCAAALVYTTFPSRAAAIEAGRILVEQRAAGCINILPAMTAIYVWNDVTEISDEVVLIAKVTASGVAAAMRAVRAVHPYETPAILVIPIAIANGDYLAWLTNGMSAQSS
jgi:periplasmic divalent cation tolerance protein